MRSITLPSLLMVCVIGAAAQQSGPHYPKKETPLQPICEAATPKLREAGTSKVVLTVTVNAQGGVESFKTVSPKGLRLEEIKEAAQIIKTIKFKPAKKDGRPVKVIIPVEFDCLVPSSDASKEP